jgi:membrane-associated phospholipid phosphatase
VAFPMAPPWYAGKVGAIEPVARITNRAFRSIGVERQTMVLGGLANPTAAMPSLHAGIAFLVAFFAIWRLHAWWRWLLLAYPLAMSLALVYFAEHYVIDTIMGALAAGVAMGACAWWERTRPPGVAGRSGGSRREALRSGS